MPQGKTDCYVIANNIRSLFNVGSIFRTADAFGLSKVYLTGYTGRPDHMNDGLKIGKVALGAEQWVPWEYHASATRLIKKLKSQGVQVVALENNVAAVPVRRFKPKKPCALVLGEEVKGIPKPILKLCDATVEIPMVGKKESLNVSVAFGIAAFGLFSR